MEMVDEEVTAGALKFMDKAVKDGKPFFVWWNSSRMHVFTHLNIARKSAIACGPPSVLASRGPWPRSISWLSEVW